MIETRHAPLDRGQAFRSLTIPRTGLWAPVSAVICVWRGFLWMRTLDSLGRILDVVDD